MICESLSPIYLLMGRLHSCLSLKPPASCKSDDRVKLGHVPLRLCQGLRLRQTVNGTRNHYPLPCLERCGAHFRHRRRGIGQTWRKASALTHCQLRVLAQQRQQCWQFHLARFASAARDGSARNRNGRLSRHTHDASGPRTDLRERQVQDFDLQIWPLSAQGACQTPQRRHDGQARQVVGQDGDSRVGEEPAAAILALIRTY